MCIRDRPITQATTYLACAPKSNAVLVAYSEARKDVLARGALPVPLHLRNAETKLMEQMGYGGDYKYPHEFEGAYVVDNYLPDALAARRYYTPAGNGSEGAIKERLQSWAEARARKNR